MKPALPFASKGIASTVLNLLGEDYKGKKLPSEQDLWLSLLAAKDQRLRLDTLKYLTDRRDGKPAQCIITADTRETAPELDFGNLIMPAPGNAKPGAVGKPN